MKTVIITRPDHLAISFWRDGDAIAALGDEDPIAAVGVRPGDGLLAWDWKGKSGVKLFNRDD